MFIREAKMKKPLAENGDVPMSLGGLDELFCCL
jgi:hypothetical protein